ncbi:MAG: hypothetical protein F4Z01_06860 [Gammaproteobacteria bacterium]|nr:hypothetical protein [Gammaproteobacteria bacterium]
MKNTVHEKKSVIPMPIQPSLAAMFATNRGSVDWECKAVSFAPTPVKMGDSFLPFVIVDNKRYAQNAPRLTKIASIKPTQTQGVGMGTPETSKAESVDFPETAHVRVSIKK